MVAQNPRAVDEFRQASVGGSPGRAARGEMHAAAQLVVASIEVGLGDAGHTVAVQDAHDGDGAMARPNPAVRRAGQGGGKGLSQPVGSSSPAALAVDSANQNRTQKPTRALAPDRPERRTTGHCRRMAGILLLSHRPVRDSPLEEAPRVVRFRRAAGGGAAGVRTVGPRRRSDGWLRRLGRPATLKVVPAAGRKLTSAAGRILPLAVY